MEQIQQKSQLYKCFRKHSAQRQNKLPEVQNNQLFSQDFPFQHQNQSPTNKFATKSRGYATQADALLVAKLSQIYVKQPITLYQPIQVAKQEAFEISGVGLVTPTRNHQNQIQSNFKKQIQKHKFMKNKKNKPEQAKQNLDIINDPENSFLPRINANKLGGQTQSIISTSANKNKSRNLQMRRASVPNIKTDESFISEPDNQYTLQSAGRKSEFSKNAKPLRLIQTKEENAFKLKQNVIKRRKRQTTFQRTPKILINNTSEMNQSFQKSPKRKIKNKTNLQPNSTNLPTRSNVGAAQTSFSTLSVTVAEEEALDITPGKDDNFLDTTDGQIKYCVYNSPDIRHESSMIS